jgi:hypothetical protein
MKKCICCGAESDASASVCANCGEGSWSDSRIVVLRTKDEPNESSVVVPKEPDVKPTISETVSSPVVNDDSDTVVDAPRVRRGKRPN